MKRFSFIIPVYNCGQYLTTCVDRIRAVGLDDYEIILVDDGSFDQSGAICNALSQKYREIYAVRQENQGVSAARNHGLQLSCGDYVLFLDADDEIEPGKLRELLQLIAEDDTIDMAAFGMSFDYYYHGKCYRRDNLTGPVEGKLYSNQWIKRIPELYEANFLSPIWNKVFKRSLLTDNRLELSRDMFLYEDLEFSLRYLAHCEVVWFSPEVIYHYRQAEDEGNAGRRLKKIQHLPELIGKIEAALDDLIEKKQAEEWSQSAKSILSELYLVLAREKISVSDAKGIRQICDDFAAWAESKNAKIPEQSRTFAECLIKRKVYRLLVKRYYTALRHKVAVRLKNTKWYQKQINGQ